jgi:hypothetical protein
MCQTRPSLEHDVECGALEPELSPIRHADMETRRTRRRTGHGPFQLSLKLWTSPPVACWRAVIEAAVDRRHSAQSARSGASVFPPMFNALQPGFRPVHQPGVGSRSRGRAVAEGLDRIDRTVDRTRAGSVAIQGSAINAVLRMRAATWSLSRPSCRACVRQDPAATARAGCSAQSLGRRLRQADSFRSLPASQATMSPPPSSALHPRAPNKICSLTRRTSRGPGQRTNGSDLGAAFQLLLEPAVIADSGGLDAECEPKRDQDRGWPTRRSKSDGAAWPRTRRPSWSPPQASRR